MNAAPRQLDESAVAAGTVLLTAREVAPRLGLSPSARGIRTLIARVRRGLIPCHRPNRRTYLFHWPTVAAGVANSKAKGVR